MKYLVLIIIFFSFSVCHSQTDMDGVDLVVSKNLHKSIKGTWVLKKINHLDKSNFNLLCPEHFDEKTIEQKPSDSTFIVVKVKFKYSKLTIDNLGKDGKKQRIRTKYHLHDYHFAEPECYESISIGNELCNDNHCLLKELNGKLYCNYYYPENWLIVVSEDRKTAYTFERQK